jgi:hypothetical protein
VRIEDVVVPPVRAEQGLAVGRGGDAALAQGQPRQQHALVVRIGDAQHPAALRIGPTHGGPFAGVDQGVRDAVLTQDGTHPVGRIALGDAVERHGHARHTGRT